MVSVLRIPVVNFITGHNDTFSFSRKKRRGGVILELLMSFLGPPTFPSIIVSLLLLNVHALKATHPKEFVRRC
jgi:hypothetical protein